jgi:hypothetical protein
MEIFSYNWSIDPLTMEECLQEWNTKVRPKTIDYFKENLIF